MAGLYGRFRQLQSKIGELEARTPNPRRVVACVTLDPLLGDTEESAQAAYLAENPHHAGANVEWIHFVIVDPREAAVMRGWA